MLKKSFPSSIEKAIISAIDYHNANGDFDILVFFEREYYHCSCSLSQTNSRYTIKNMICCRHGLSEVYSPGRIDDSTAAKYDYAYFNNGQVIEFDGHYSATCPELAAYNADILSALSAINSESDKPVFVYGEYIGRNAVLYGLQTRLGRVVPVMQVAKLNLKSRFNFSDKVLQEAINVSERAKVVNYIGSNILPVFIPSEKNTADSLFWGETCWKDIIPEDCPTCEIAGVPCYFVNVSFEIDGFNNVFCRADDGCGHVRYSAVHTPWGRPQTPAYVQNDNKAMSDMSANETSRKEEVPEAVKNTESAALPDAAFVTVRKVEIPENAVINYTDIFTERYVCDVEDVYIRDPYLYLPYQLANLRNFIQSLNAVIHHSGSAKKLKSIKVETSKASGVADTRNFRKIHPNGRTFQSEAEYLEWIEKKQEEAFEKLQKIQKKNGVEFTVSYSTFHDRKVEFSNGWTADMGRGLDIFKRQDDDTQPRCCKECTIIFSFGQNGQEATRVVRKPQ